MRVLGIDPGVTTGLFLLAPGIMHHRQCVGLLAVGRAIEELTTDFTVKDFVIERFNIKDSRASNGRDTTDTLDAIGVSHYFAQLRGAKVTFRTNDQKNRVPNALLDERGWLASPVHEWRHANDAARHVLGWSLKEGRN